MATWPPWRTRCRAHSSQTGLPCRAWAVTGCPTCVAHGSGTRKAKAAGLARVEITRVRARAAQELAKGLAADVARWQADPQAQRADGLAVLREIRAGMGLER